jgi:hypothetical protein
LDYEPEIPEFSEEALLVIDFTYSSDHTYRTMNDRIKESDWKIFKELQPLALKRYCEGVMEEVDQIISDTKRDSHERYIEMYKIVRDGDKKLAHMFDGFSRSRAMNQLVMYYGNDLLKEEEIAQLSDETRERIRAILEIWKE